MVMKSFRGKMPQLGARVWVDENAVVIGDVTIGDDSSVWPLVAIRGDMHRITIGARTSIQDNSCLHITHASTYKPEGYPLSIGDDVTVGHMAMLHGCTVGNRVLVGMGTTILDGAVVEDEIIIGPARQAFRVWFYVHGLASETNSSVKRKRNRILSIRRSKLRQIERRVFG